MIFKLRNSLLMALIAMTVLPVSGIWSAGKPLQPYLEFPPMTRYVVHEVFAWPVFVFLAVTDLILFSVLFASVIRCIRKTGPKVNKDTAGIAKPQSGFIFPWWGWVGIFTVACSWTIAWNRFSWAGFIQKHTFVFLWMGYIIIVNGLCVFRTSTCPMMEYRRFWLLFPFSAVFWWFFEYLNRFVQNWYYLGVQDFSSMAYALFASISFSTVLPAVYSTHYLIHSFFPKRSSHASGYRLMLKNPLWAWAVLFVSAVSFFYLGVFPNILFPLLWVSPFLLILSIGSLVQPAPSFSSILSLDATEIQSAALSALICGIFWEMWNYKSLAKWEYAVPYVDVLHIFEMPLLGYGGYLPFGLECILICHLIMARR